MIMTSGNMKITPGQLFCILFLSRFFTNMTYIASIDASLNSSQAIFMTLIATVFMLVCAVPVMIFLKTDSERGMIERCNVINPVFGKIICIIMLLIYIFYCIIATARFEIFASSVMFPRSQVEIFLLFVMCICVFVAYRGIEATGRAGFIFVILLIISFAVVLLSLRDKYDLLNLGAFDNNNLKSLIKASFFSVSRTVEISTVPVVAEKVKGKLVKPLFRWIFAISLALIIIGASVSFILGDFGYSQMFCTYNLSVLVKIGVIEKLDSVISSVWILCYLIKMAYMLIVCGILLENIVPKGKILSLTVVPVCVYIGALVISYSILSFEKIILSPVSSYLFVAVTVILPLIVIITEKLKGLRLKK